MTIALEVLIYFFAATLTLVYLNTQHNAFQDGVQKDFTKKANEEHLQYLKHKKNKDPDKKDKIVPYWHNFQTPTDDPIPSKKQNNDPVADKTSKGKPTPNNPDNPIPNIPERNIPNKTPTPPPFSNQTPTPTPQPDPINVGKPPFFKRTGRFIYTPIEKATVNLFSMPVNASTKQADWTELNIAHGNSNKLDTYIQYMTDAKTDKPTGKYKISDLIPYITPPTGNVVASPTLFSGTESIGKLHDAYDLYSDGYLSDPIFFIPTTINVHTIKGVTNDKRRLAPEIDQNFDPNNTEIPNLIRGQSRFTIPKEIKIENLLEFAGNVSSYEGGAEKWEQYKKNPNVLKDPNFFKVPSSSDILNEDPSIKGKKYQKQNLKIHSELELALLVAGTIYTKAGLHEFPSDPLPSVKNPNPIPENPNDPKNPNNQLQKSDIGVRINNLATAMAYIMSWFNFKVGDFPAEVEVPDPVQPEQTKKERVNISTALTGLLTMTGVGVAIANFNKDVNLTNAGQIEAAKNAALKAADCSCTNMANSGMNTSPKARCSPRAMNFTNAKGFQSMLTGTLQEMTACRQGVENMESQTIKDMLQNIMFGVNIIKSAFFKGEKELENEQKVLKEMLTGKINEKELDEFIAKFNNQETPLTKDYPIKAKIVKRPKNTNTKKK